MATLYLLDGFYRYIHAPKGRGNLTGEIRLEEDGSLAGEIYDSASRVPNQQLRGYIRKEEGMDRLLFLKFPPDVELADLVYDLTKHSDATLEGNYSGTWSALPFKIRFDKDFQLFLAQINFTVASVSDTARIRVRGISE